MEQTLESRVTGLERDVGNLVSAVRALTEESHQSREVINAALSAIRTEIGSRTRTNWSTLASWAGVIISFIGAIGALAIVPLKYQVIETSRQLRSHEQLEGHPTAVEKTANLEKRYDEIISQQAVEIRELDTRLQREMRDLDAQGQLQIEQLDGRLQREMQLVNAGINSSQWERIRAIERQVFGKVSQIEYGAPDGAKLND